MAAVILLMLSAGYVGIVRGPSNSDGSSDNSAVVPAVQQATPPATAAGCGTTGRASAPVGSPVAVNVTMASPEASSPNPVAFVWATTGAPESPKQVSHMAIDPQCRLWVMDVQANRFLIFDLDGTLLDTWGEPGSGDGQFDFAGAQSDNVGGIAFAPDGGFYVSDASNERVQQFDAERRFVRTWSTTGSDPEKPGTPSWLAVGPDGNVYVTVFSVREIVQVYTPDGTFLRAFGSNDPGLGRLSGSGPLAFDPDGNLWILDPWWRALVQFSPDGEPLARFESPEIGTFLTGLAIDAAGRFFVVNLEEDTVSVFAPDGTFLYAWSETGLSDGEFLDPYSVVLDGSGGVYVTDYGNPRIQKFLIQP
jgi:streptogramin lyase